MTDSRCPTGAYCFWAGNAIISLELNLRDNKTHKIELNTNPNFPVDTTIDDIYILLTELTPHPEINTEIDPEDYKARLTMANISKLKSNAKIISFNSEKCECCWGWKIKIANDTIMADDNIIGKTVGYNINHPVNIYIELGDLKQTCSDMRSYDYYNVKELIKLK